MMTDDQIVDRISRAAQSVADQAAAAELNAADDVQAAVLSGIAEAFERFARDLHDPS